MDPKKIAAKNVEKLKRDTFAVVWIALIVALLLMTVFFKTYIKDMIVISILFLLFWYIEPLVLGVTGRTVTTFLSRGRRVPAWKRFPLFFLAIMVVYFAYVAIQATLDRAFPATSVNIVLVFLWVGFLFLLWVYKFSKA